MLSYIVVAALLPAFILGYPIISCGPGFPSPQALRIEGCSVSPCNVTRASVIPFEADLIANELSNTLTLEIDISSFGVTYPYPLPPALQNVCAQLRGATCPVQPNQFLTQAASLPVIVEYQGGVPITLRSRIYNASGSVLSCSIIEARVY